MLQAHTPERSAPFRSPTLPGASIPCLKAGEEQWNTKHSAHGTAVPGWRCSWTGTSCYQQPGRSWWGRHMSAASQGPAGTGGCSHHCPACTRAWTLRTEQGRWIRASCLSTLQGICFTGEGNCTVFTMQCLKSKKHGGNLFLSPSSYSLLYAKMDYYHGCKLNTERVREGKTPPSFSFFFSNERKN